MSSHQSLRRAAAEQPEQREIDSQTLAQSLARLLAHARQQPFVDLRGERVGDWSEWLRADAALCVADLLAHDTTPVRRWLHERAPGLTAQALQRTWLQQALRLDGWWHDLRSHDDALSLQLVDRMAQWVSHPLSVWLDRLEPALATDVPAGLRARWQRSGSGPTAALGATPVTWPLAIAQVSDAIEDLQRLARPLWPANLRGGRQDPGAALLLTAARLMDVARRRLNACTPRQVDFYLRDVLGQTPRTARADHVLLALQAEPGAARRELPAGTRFEAGEDERGAAILFQSDRALSLGDAQVAECRIRHLHRDPLVSPEREFGWVSHLRVRDLSDDATPERAPPVGLVVTSPLLDLAEGLRQIHLSLTLVSIESTDLALQQAHAALRAGQVQTWLQACVARALDEHGLLDAEDRRDPAALVERLLQVWPVVADPLGFPHDALDDALLCWDWALALQARDAGHWRLRVGRLMRRWLLAREDRLPADALAALRFRARSGSNHEPDASWTRDDPLHLLHGEGPPDHAAMATAACSDLLLASLSEAGGWRPVAGSQVRLTHEREASGDDRRRLVVTLTLQPDDPPLAPCTAARHGLAGPPGAPGLRLLCHEQARLHPWSLLSDLVVQDVDVAVQVRGLRRLRLRNDIGDLDAGQPFQPFGPLPSLGSSLQFDADELRGKPLTRLDLQLEWSGLPEDAAAQSALAGGVHLAQPGLRSQGQWLPGSVRPQALFAPADGPGARPSPRQTLRLDAAALRLRGLGPAQATQGRDLGWRIALCAPAGAFGHHDHGSRLAQALQMRSARRGTSALPLPPPPYTPVLASVRLDYDARQRLHTGRATLIGPDEAPSHGGLEVWHQLPGGLSRADPSPEGHRPWLLPELGPDHALYIGLSSAQAGDSLSGPLTLLFELDDGRLPSHAAAQPPALGWAQLSGDRWHALPASCCLDDGTSGLQTSGIVTLDLPARPTLGNHILPAHLHWLRLASPTPIDALAALRSVRAQALRATRVLTGNAEPMDDNARARPVPAGGIRAAVPMPPGLRRVEQVGPSRGLWPAEDRSHFRARCTETLQHRQRGVLAWDLERMVLERHPQVRMAHVLDSAQAAAAGLPPGVVRLVLLPDPRQVPARPDSGPQLGAPTLAAIAADLQALMPPHARLEVCNVVYEWVQVIARVQVAPARQDGQLLQQLHRAIADWACPWEADGEPVRLPTLDWCLRGDELQARLSRVEGVRRIDGLSLLHVNPREIGGHRLVDSASGAEGGADLPVLRPHRHHSLPLAMNDHHLTLHDGRSPPVPPTASGVGRLQVARTFILESQPR